MTTLKSLNFLLFFLGYTSLLLAQSNAISMTALREHLAKETSEITAAENAPIFEENPTNKYPIFKAEIWPNPSNIGKVRLSIENLLDDLLYIQVFNDKEELVQEGVIRGNLGTKLEHTLNLPNAAAGNYSIKLSNTQKLLKDLNLEIL